MPILLSVESFNSGLILSINQPPVKKSLTRIVCCTNNKFP